MKKKKTFLLLIIVNFTHMFSGEDLFNRRMHKKMLYKNPNDVKFVYSVLFNIVAGLINAMKAFLLFPFASKIFVCSKRDVFRF
jgi:hypothetical protein